MDSRVSAEQPLELMRARGSEARDTVRSELSSGVIRAYLAKRSDGGLVIAANRQGISTAVVDATPTPAIEYQEEGLDLHDPTQHATATAFTLTRLLRSGAGADPSESLGVSRSDFDAIAKNFLTDFDALYRNLPAGAGDTNVEKSTTDSPKLAESSLPNPYNSSLHLSALAALCQWGWPINAETAASAANVARSIAGWFTQSIRISDLDMKSVERQLASTSSSQALQYNLGASNAYLTYLCVSALYDWSLLLSRCGKGELSEAALPEHAEEWVDAEQDHIEAALTIAYATGVADLSRQIASQAINRESLFDAMDIACTLATTALAGRAPGLNLVDEYWRGLLREAVRCLSRDYLLPDGSFAPKGGAFTNENKYNIVLSSAEIGDILFSSVGDFGADELVSYDPLIAAVIRRREGRRGWGSAAPNAHARHVFASASALALLRRFDSAVTSVLAASATTALAVPSFSIDEKVAAIDVGPVWETIERDMIGPLRADRWDRADLSLLLHGPPGTAKTTIAKKIAQSLRWPLLELDQGSFLKRGVAELEAEAERIFALVLDLRNTVVLFDEIEGMVGGRGPGSSESSRFLTTSMLPRIHHLRDHAQVVFIIATNYKDKLDAAATRPGRIDQVLSVDLPTAKQVEDMLASLVSQHDPSGRLRIAELLDEPGIATLMSERSWTYKYLELLVRRCATHRSLAKSDTEVGDDCVAFAKAEVKSLRDRFSAEQKAWSEGMRNGEQA